MSTAVAVWSLKLVPGGAKNVIPLRDLRITNVALGEELVDENGRTSVRLVYIGPSADSDEEDEEDEKDEDKDEEKDDEDEGSSDAVPTILCSLTPGKIEQAMIDIVLEGDQEYLFEGIGKNTVYLTGNYIDQPFHDMAPFDDEDDEDDDEDDAYDLREVSSDVEVDADEMDVASDEDDAGRFEEVEEDDSTLVTEAPKESKKRARESDVADDAAEQKLSKKEKKKLKKLKAENGEAIPVGDAKTSEKGEKKKEGKDDKKAEKKEKKPKLSEPKVLAGGVKIEENRVGEGAAAKAGNRVSVRYVGKLQNGTIFDSNTKGKPFQFRLGAGEVIEGWDIGVAGMKAGGERLITVPPAKGYGKKKQGTIPANSTLIFEVKVIAIN